MPSPTVAVLGASADRTKFSNKSLRAHQRAGYQVFAINPRGGEIEGLPVYRTLADVPIERLSRITVYLPSAVGIEQLPQIAAKGCDELFLNPGTTSEELLAEAQRLALPVVQACSIVNLGYSPRDFSDA